MSAPSIMITVPLEAAPQVVVDCLTESEVDRLVEWLNAHPELLALVGRALDLRAQAKAA